MSNIHGGIGSLAPTIQQPSVTRMVHYYVEMHKQGGGTEMFGPLAAIIVKVKRHDRVNLAVFSEQGQSFGAEDVLLVQSGGQVPATGAYCVWPTRT